MTKHMNDANARTIPLPISRLRPKAQSKPQTNPSTASTSSKPGHSGGSSGQQVQAMDTETIAPTVCSMSDDTNASPPSEAKIDSARETSHDLHSTSSKQSQDSPDEETASTQSTQVDFQPTDEDYSGASASVSSNETHFGGNGTPETVTIDGMEDPPFFKNEAGPQVTNDRSEEPVPFKTEEPWLYEPKFFLAQDVPSHRVPKTYHCWTPEQEKSIVDALYSSMGRAETLGAVKKVGFNKPDIAIKGRIGQVTEALQLSSRAFWTSERKAELLAAIDSKQDLMEIQQKLFPTIAIVELHGMKKRLRPKPKTHAPKYHHWSHDKDDEEMSLSKPENSGNEDFDGEYSNSEYFNSEGSDDESERDHPSEPREEQARAPIMSATHSPTSDQRRPGAPTIPPPPTETLDSQSHAPEQAHSKPHDCNATETSQSDSSTIPSPNDKTPGRAHQPIRNPHEQPGKTAQPAETHSETPLGPEPLQDTSELASGVSTLVAYKSGGDPTTGVLGLGGIVTDRETGTTSRYQRATVEDCSEEGDW
ncbi:hypothetical protein MMC30_000172 [Trapelia coarctata]|nr:hypothetical protein [Trapelia coarctata]